MAECCPGLQTASSLLALLLVTLHFPALSRQYLAERSNEPARKQPPNSSFTAPLPNDLCNQGSALREAGAQPSPPASPSASILPTPAAGQHS